MGAIASGGVQVVNEQVVGRLGLGEADLRRAAESEGRELARRERRYREGRPPPDLTGRVVILVDDGLATGSTMRAAVAAARRLGPARVVVAVPTAPPSTCQRLRERPTRWSAPAPRARSGRSATPTGRSPRPPTRRSGPPPGRLGGRPRPQGPAGPGPGDPTLTDRAEERTGPWPRSTRWSRGATAASRPGQRRCRRPTAVPARTVDPRRAGGWAPGQKPRRGRLGVADAGELVPVEDEGGHAGQGAAAPAGPVAEAAPLEGEPGHPDGGLVGDEERGTGT